MKLVNMLHACSPDIVSLQYFVLCQQLSSHLIKPGQNSIPITLNVLQVFKTETIVELSPVNRHTRLLEQALITSMVTRHVQLRVACPENERSSYFPE